jgi:molybdenum cofactor biosynthesis enzyme MoaA
MRCFFLDHGLTVRPDGRVSPCCQWRDNNQPQRFHDDWQSHFAKKKEELRQGWIPECNECRLSETISGESDRTDWLFGHHKFRLTVSGTGRRYWDLKLHHTCNLTCRMCSPTDSSSWHNLVKQNLNEGWNEHILDRCPTDPLPKYGWKNQIPKLFEHIQDLEMIKFTGGEPFMIPQVKQVLEEIDKRGKASDVAVRFTTNATFPLTKEWITLLKKFSSVTMIYSVNGIKSRYEYIRQNAKWSDTLKNILNIQDLGFIDGSVSELYQMLSYDIVDQTIDFWKEQNIPCHFNHLTHPEYHSLHALPTHLRLKYDHLDHYKFDQKLFDQFLTQTEIHDRLYGKDIRKEIPELFE